MTQIQERAWARIHVIITRPIEQAQLWQQQLELLGAEVSLLPVLAIKAVQEKDLQQRIKNQILALDEYSKIIFVSQNAVKHAWQWIDQYWPQLPTGIECFAIGSSTAAALKKQVVDFDASIKAAAEAMNSEALLQLVELQQVKTEKILICRGCGGRPTLEQELQRRGARVDLCELYRRVLPEQAASGFKNLLPLLLHLPVHDGGSNSAKTCVLSVHSGESLENLNRVIQVASADEPTSARAKSTVLLVPGERVAGMAQQLGFQQIITAQNATDAAMTEALGRWAQNNWPGNNEGVNR